MENPRQHRLILDRDRKDTPYLFDGVAADKAVLFFSNLYHVTGKWAGKPFIPATWQKEIIEDIFGWKRRSDMKRRFRMVDLFMARKNGKSELASGFGLLGLAGDKEPRAEVYSVAGDRGQASIIFNTARDMALNSEFLANRLRCYNHHIFNPTYNSTYKVLSADANNKFGFNPHFTLVDELFVQPNSRLYDALTTGDGTRDQPLHINISTAGFDPLTLCGDVWRHAVDVLNGVIEDDELYPVIYSVPDDADWTDETVWKLANPALGDFLSIDPMRTLFQRAKDSIEKQNTFKRFRLNMWTQQETHWMDLDKWDVCKTSNVEALRSDLKGRECYGGLDLASRLDLVALALDFPIGKDKYKSLMFYWCPEKSIETRSRKDRVPYDGWADAGYIRPTPGNVVDYDFIRRDINELSREFKIKKLGIDEWNATQIGTQLTGDGIEVVEMRQGFKTLSEPMKEIEKIVTARNLEHDGSPVMRWNVNNTSPEKNATDDCKPSKELSREKIDGVTALVMAHGLAIREPVKKPSRYETGGVRTA
jgi:phage terminase large subunit-like protein